MVSLFFRRGIEEHVPGFVNLTGGLNYGVRTISPTDDRVIVTTVTAQERGEPSPSSRFRPKGEFRMNRRKFIASTGAAAVALGGGYTPAAAASGRRCPDETGLPERPHE